jgi:uncharacterized protein
MPGTLLNAAAIILGSIAGLTQSRPLAMAQQLTLKALLALLMVLAGLHLAWASLGPTVGQMAKQLGVVVLAMILGRILGRLLHLQKLSNRLGQSVREKLTDVKPVGPGRSSEAFWVGTVLFCAGPLGVLGAVQDGLGGHWQTLGVKAMLDGLTAMSLVRTFGPAVALAAVPVVAFQGTVTLLARWLAQLAPHPAMIDAANATGGLLVFCAALLVFNVRKVQVADYLPSLGVAPLLRWMWG